MQDIKDADPQCNITRKEKPEQEQECVRFALCRIMRMYFVTPDKLTTAGVCCVTRALQCLFPDIHHYFSMSGIVSWMLVMYSLPSPFEAH